MQMFLWATLSFCILSFTILKIIEKVLYFKNPSKYPLLSKKKADTSNDSVKEVR